MKRKLRLIWAIIRCHDWIVITRKGNDVAFNYRMDEHRIRKYTWFLNNHIEREHEIEQQIKDVLNQP